MVRPTHPRSVAVTAVAVFVLGLLNGWRAAALAGQLAVLDRLGVSLDPRLRLAAAVVWAAAFVVTAVALWRRQEWTRTAVPLLLTLYALYRLALLLFAQPATARMGWPGDLVFYTAVVVAAAWALNRPAARRYFQRPPTTDR